MEIDKLIIAETVRCEKDFACLSEKTHVYCKVENCINKKIHFIERKDLFQCRYVMCFGDCYICTCPTRKEIYNKYGI